MGDLKLTGNYITCDKIDGSSGFGFRNYSGVMQWKDSGGSWTGFSAGTGVAHGGLAGLTTGDDHTQYALLAGRSGGQTLIGGSGSGDDLILQSTANATRGAVYTLDAFGAGVDPTADGRPVHLKGNTDYAILFERPSTDTNIYATAANLLITTTGDMADGFGTGFNFAIRDDANVINTIAQVVGIRDGADNSGYLSFRPFLAGSANERVRIDKDGVIYINPAVGLTTNIQRNSSGLFQITSPKFSGAYPVTTEIYDASALAADIGGGITFSATDGSSTRWYSGIQGAKENATSGNYAGYFRIFTRANGGAFTEAVRVTSAQNVKIGANITVADGNLHVADSSFTETFLAERSGQASDVQYGAMRILTTKTSNMGDSFGTKAYFCIRDDAAVINPIASIGARRNGADNSGDLTLGTYSGGAETEHVRIDKNGKVWIGSGTGLDTNLYRSAANTLKTDDNFALGGASEQRFYNAGDTYYVGFKGGNATANKIWTLPLADGTSGQVLTTDGSATLSWATVSGGGGGGSYITDSSTGDTYGQLIGDIDDLNTTYTVSNSSYISGSLQVYLNGMLQLLGTHWNETTPASGTFDFVTAPSAGDNIMVVYNGSYQVDSNTGDGAYGAVSGAIDDANTTFTVSTASYTTGKLLVFLNGMLQLLGTHWNETTPASGTFDFVTAPATGDNIMVVY